MAYQLAMLLCCLVERARNDLDRNGVHDGIDIHRQHARHNLPASRERHRRKQNQKAQQR
jgi:hypothetical protein